MNRIVTSATNSLSGHSDEFSMLDFQKQTPKNEYTRSQLLEMRHDDTADMIEKAKNLKIAERIIRKNAEKKLAEAKSGGGASGKKGLVQAKCGPVAKAKPIEPDVDEFWSKVTTTSSNRNSAAAVDQNDDYELANPWDKSGFDEPTDFTFRNKAKVDNWLEFNHGRHETPTQFSQCNDDFSNQSNPMFFPSERNASNETASMVSNASAKSAYRTQLLDKTAKLKQTLANLKKQKPNN